MFIDYCKLTNSLTVDILGMNEKVLEIFFQTLEILTKPKCRIGTLHIVKSKMYY